MFGVAVGRDVAAWAFAVEFLETTLNRLVKGAKVLGENDAKNTNVDDIQLPDEEDENQIDLDI